MPGQAGLGAATCLEELSEEQHPPGPGWQGGMGTSASFGLSAEGSANPRWEQAGGRVACGGRRAWGGGGAPSVALPERHQCANTRGMQVLCGLLEELLMELVPWYPSSCSLPKSEY